MTLLSPEPLVTQIRTITYSDLLRLAVNGATVAECRVEIYSGHPLGKYGEQEYQFFVAREHVEPMREALERNPRAVLSWVRSGEVREQVDGVLETWRFGVKESLYGASYGPILAVTLSDRQISAAEN